MRTRYVLKELPQNRATRFSLVPEQGALDQLAQDLGLSALRKLRFEGALQPMKGADWRLEGHLGATVVQPCRVTLAPVTTRIDETLERRYLAHYQEPDEAEAEMPEDDTAEPLPDAIDLQEVLAEALALAVPPYPRSAQADDAPMRAAPPGVAPLADEQVKPFAALAELRAKLGKGDAPDGD